MPIDSALFQSLCENYSHLKQYAADSQSLVSLAHTAVDVAYQRQCAEAEAAYNAQLNSLAAIHGNHTEAHAALLARQETALAQREEKRAQIATDERRMNAVVHDAMEGVNRLRLPRDLHRQLHAPVQPFAISAAIDPLTVLAEYAGESERRATVLAGVAEKIARQQYERRLLRPTIGRFLALADVLFIAGTLTCGPFQDGSMPGLYWLVWLLSNSVGAIVVINAIIFIFLAVRAAIRQPSSEHIVGAILVLVVVGFIFLGGLVFSMAQQGETFVHVASTNTADHIYYLAAENQSGCIESCWDKADAWLFECDSLGIICQQVGHQQCLSGMYSSGDLRLVKDVDGRSLNVLHGNSLIFPHITDPTLEAIYFQIKTYCT